MADIRAFRGFRYDLGRVGSLSDVVAPPYDVIDPALQTRLYDASPFNAVRVEYAREAGEDKYAAAAETIRGWVTDDAVRQDTRPCLYVIEQEFTVEGRTYTRRGFMARVRLEPFGQGKIYPHEQTMSGPKEDRLKLYRATNMNLSPVFGLYPDEANEVYSQLEPHTRKNLPTTATDHLGVTSRLWPVQDERVISAVMGKMGPLPVFIADGHHRYETGVKYLEERRELGDVANDEAAANFILMMLVSMSDPGLIILPTHRLISGLPEMTHTQLAAALAPMFEVTIKGVGDAAARETWEEVELHDTQDLLGFCSVADRTWMTARFTAHEKMAALASQHSEDWRGLGVSILHVAAIDHLLSHQGAASCKYVHLLDEVTTAVRDNECSVAALVPSATMKQVEEIAGHLEKMPAKSTYFYPKLLTGLVFNSLKVN